MCMEPDGYSYKMMDDASLHCVNGVDHDYASYFMYFMVVTAPVTAIACLVRKEWWVPRRIKASQLMTPATIAQAAAFTPPGTHHVYSVNQAHRPHRGPLYDGRRTRCPENAGRHEQLQAHRGVDDRSPRVRLRSRRANGRRGSERGEGLH